MMQEEKRQLFKLVRNVSLPRHATRDPMSKKWRGHTRSGYTLFAFFWPSGEPCVPVEMYLNNRAEKLACEPDRGGSLRVEACAISHFVRFCVQEKIRFRDINDDDFSRFADQLVTEIGIRRDGWSARGGNTVNFTISAAIRFLFWYQKQFGLIQPLVGTVDDKARIALMRQRVAHFTGNYAEVLAYPDRPPAEPPVPKSPMPDKYIKVLWDAALDTRASASQNNASGVSEQLPLRDLQNEYLYRRRILTLMIMEETGLRPGELCLMKCEPHDYILSSRNLRIPTLKRREARPFVRTLPCTLELASALKQLLVIRAELLSRLPVKQRALAEEHQRLLINVRGGVMKPSSLEREFSRLAARAGIATPNRACLSMYRHRFLSRRAAFYIKMMKLQNIDPNIPDLPVSDDATILGRLVELSGRKTLTSLRPYIALGWKELDIFSNIDSKIASDDAIRSAIHRLSQLSAEVIRNKNAAKVNQLLLEIDELTKRLTELAELFAEVHARSE